MKVVVVGAGPAGLTLAAELARRNVPCRIFERNRSPTQESRAVAIHARTLEVFAAMGIGGQILEVGHRIHGVNISAGGHRILHFSFDELASPYPFAIDLPQSVTEQILIEHLRGFGIEVERGVEIAGLRQHETGVELSAGNERLRAAYVIGCDGAHSSVRQAAGLPFEGESPEEHFILADVPIRWEGADDEWHLWFHEDGLLAIFPLAGDSYRVIAEVGPGIWTLDADHLRTLFEERGPEHASVGEPSWISSYRIQQRKLVDYRRGRIFLAGDAAHVYSPAGGQGMNTGIQDSFNLAWKLAMVLRGNAPDSLLASYTMEREAVASSVLALTENIASIANLRWPVSQQIRNRAMPILAGLEVVESRLVNRLAELSGNYRRSSIVGQTGRWYIATPLPGDRAPNSALGNGRQLFELWRERHVVLLFTGEHPAAEDLRGFTNIDRYMRQGYPDEIVTYLVARIGVDWEGSKIVDTDGGIHRSYSAGVPCLYLIRPDGYVSFRSLSADPLPLIEHLNRVYEPPMPEVTENDNLSG